MNQYNLTHMMLPKFPRQLLPDLESIEHIMNKKRVETVRQGLRIVQPWLVPSPVTKKGHLRAQVTKFLKRLAS